MDISRCRNLFLPDTAAKWSAQKIRENSVPLIAAFVFGLLSYMFAFTNKLVNHDEVQSLFTKGTTVTSGRWGLGALDSIFPNYSMPWINGILALILMAIAVAVLVHILSIRSKVLQVLLAGSIIAFPSLIGTFAYMFTSHAFALSFLMAVMAVWFLKKERLIFWILAMGCMIFSLSIYQSYIAVAAGLLVLVLIRQLMESEPLLPILRKGIGYVFFLAASLGLYYGATQVIFILKDVTLNSYADNNVSFSLAGIPAAIGEAYTSFFRFFTEGYHGLIPTELSRLLHGLCITAALLLLGIHAVKHTKREAGRIALLLALLGILPLAINCMYLFTTPDAVHTLVLYGFVCVYGLFVLAADVVLTQSFSCHICAWCRSIAANVLSLALAVIICCNVYLANETWLNLHLKYENSYAFYTSLFAKIQTLPEFQPGTRLALIGEYQDPAYFEDNFAFTEHIVGIKGFSPDTYSKGRFLEYYLGISLPFASEEEIQTLAQLEEVMQMPVYPYYGSIAVMGDTIVVKLS